MIKIKQILGLSEAINNLLLWAETWFLFIPRLFTGFTLDELRGLTELQTGLVTTFYCSETGKEGYWKVNNSPGISPVDNTGTRIITADGVVLDRVIELYIRPEWFGAKVDGVFNDTVPFIASIEYAMANKKSIYIENQIAVNSQESIVINRPITIKGKNSGAKHYRDIVDNYASTIKDITVFDDNTVIKPPLILFDGSNTTLFGSMPAINIEDIAIVGNGQPRKALRFFQSGWDTNIDNLSIDFFRGGGIEFDKQFDTNTDNITITRCGGKIGDNVYWAIDFDSTVGDNSNAIKFNNLHIEFCRYYIRFGRVRHIMFNNTKVEVLSSLSQPTRNGVDDDLLNPHVLFENEAREVSLDLGFMVFKETKAWIDNYTELHPELPAITAHDVPFAIQCKNTELRSYQQYKFSNFNFTCANFGEGVKLIDTGDFANVDIESSQIQTTSGDTCGIILKNSKLIDSRIYTPYTKSNIPVISIEKSTFYGNNIECLGYGENTGYALEILGDRNVIGPNKYRSFVENYRAIATTSRQSMYIRSRAMLQLTDDTYKSLMGISVIDYSNIVIDLAKFDTCMLRLAFTENATIKTIKGAFSGEVVRFHCDSNTSKFTFSLGGESNFDLKTGDYTITQNTIATFIYTGATWVRNKISLLSGIKTVSSLYNLSIDDFGENGELILLCNASSGSFIINNTNNLNLLRLRLTVIKTDNSTNTITVIGTINGLTNFPLIYQNESISITGNGDSTFSSISERIVKGGQATLISGEVTISNIRLKSFHFIEVSTKTPIGVNPISYKVEPSNGSVKITALNSSLAKETGCNNIIIWNIIN